MATGDMPVAAVSSDDVSFSREVGLA